MGSEVKMMKVMGMITCIGDEDSEDSDESDADNDWIVEDFRDFGDITT